MFANAAAVGGVTHEVVLDSVAQEIDLATGLVLFQWDSLDHVPLSAGYTRVPAGKKPNGPANPYDYFHMNSVGLDLDGNLLISARNTWGVYKVDHRTGSVIWTLGGKRSSFKLGPGVSFAFQHDVRVRAPGDGLLTMFDDGAGPPYVHSQSRLLKLHLDLKRMTAAVVAQRVHSPPLLASYEGNDQQLPDSEGLRRLGSAAVLQRVRPQGKARVRRALRRSELELSRLSLRLERQAVHAAGVGGLAPRQEDDRVRELEWRHGRRRLASVRR